MTDHPTPSPVTHSDKIQPVAIPLCGVWVLGFAIVALLSACDSKPEAAADATTRSSVGWPKRADVVEGEDAIWRRTGSEEPYTGPAVTRDKDWKVRYLATFQDGKRHGTEIRYYPSGLIERIDDYNHGEHIRRREYFESGQLYRDGHLRNGELYGSHRTFFEDGRARFTGSFVEELQWQGHVIDRNEDDEIMWDAWFERGRYLYGTYPEEAEEHLIEHGMIDPNTKQPTFDQKVEGRYSTPVK